MVEAFVFAVCAIIILVGAIGVIVNRNPVHAALSLVATLFGVAVLFMSLEANFLAAVQVIVYAGAIVVMFLFVIMLLGVDGADDLRVEPLVGQRPIAYLLGVLLSVGLLAVVVTGTITGAPSKTFGWVTGGDDVAKVGELLFTDYLFAFEITSLLLVIAVVGAVLLSRTTRVAQVDADELVPVLPGEVIEESGSE